MARPIHLPSILYQWIYIVKYISVDNLISIINKAFTVKVASNPAGL